MTELAEKNRLLKDMADKDGLTGIYNHRFFKVFLSRQIIQHKRYDHPLTLIMLDIDYFKKLNDTHGHQAGDSVLKQVAELLLRLTRKADLVARYGGEEFAVILTETDLRGGAVAAERIRMAFERYSFVHEGKLKLKLTASLGVAVVKQDIETADELIEAADKLLYEAKRLGRNRICFRKAKTD